MLQRLSRRTRIALALVVPLAVQTVLNLVAVAVSDRAMYNYLVPVAPIISLVAGFVFLARERWRLAIALAYFPLMFVLLLYLSLHMAARFGFSL